MDGNLLQHIPPGLPHQLQELKINENNLQEFDEDSFEGKSCNEKVLLWKNYTNLLSFC